MKGLPYTTDELKTMFGGPHPADVREALRGKLALLPEVARRVYNRDNIRDPQTTLLEIVETVLYHFDKQNRSAVARELGLDEATLVVWLGGFVLGYEGGGQ